jgi:hypothetical protein
VIGTCIETLDEDGIPLHEWDNTGGNIAVCHWMYFTGLSESSSISKNGTAGVNWGETRYLDRSEWGYGGSHITGVSINTLGTALTSSLHGFTLAPALGVSIYTAGSVYTMTWYQPKYQATYSSD